MADLTGFNANEVEPTTYDILPDGTYVAAIVASEMKPTNSGTGEYLEIKLQILEGDHKGRLLWDRLNLKNPSEKAVEIARGQLSGICRAVDVMEPRDSSDLHDRPLTIRVGSRKWGDSDELANVIKGYSPAQAGTHAMSSHQRPSWQTGGAQGENLKPL